MLEPFVYVTDAGNRRLSRFAVNGDFVDFRDGYFVPSPHFDCAARPGLLLHAVNPGKWRVERYDGNWEVVGGWGDFGLTPEGFSGQDYFPEDMPRESFYHPPERGFEREIRKRLAYWAKRRQATRSD